MKGVTLKIFKKNCKKILIQFFLIFKRALLRGLGAFFIKRKIDPIIGKKDVIYRAVLHTYLQQCLAAVHNVELFIEGGRTRTGKPCMPKSGILSVIVDAFMDGTISDALLVPVSVNYEKLVDGNFIYEQLGQKKQPETFKSAISAIWKVQIIFKKKIKIF